MKWLLVILTMAALHAQAQVKIDKIKEAKSIEQIQPPTAYAGRDQYITLPQNEVTLKGEGKTSSAKIEIKTYLWTKLSGPSKFKIVAPKRLQTQVNNLVEGEYQFLLRVTDSREAIGWDTVMVSVLPQTENQPPKADAGRDQKIILPENSVTLNGFGTDPDPNIDVSYLAFQWTKISGPPQYNIVAPSKQQTPVNDLTEGIYLFVLKVTDYLKASGWDTVMVTVSSPKKNRPPIANAGPDIDIVLPANSVNLIGSGKDPDSNGYITHYQWTKIVGPSRYTIVSPTERQTRVNDLVKEVYQFELIVTDNNGAQGRDKVNVTVYPAPPPVTENEPPIANAGDDLTITLPTDSVNLDGSGRDPGGSITNVQWTKIFGPSQFTIVDPTQAQTQVINLVRGDYQFELIVTDNKGAKDSDIAFVTVNPPPMLPNTPPIANAGPDLTITVPGSSVSLNGSGRDPDTSGFITHYLWTKIAGSPSSTIVSPSDSQTQILNLAEGTYQFKLMVMDNHGASGEDTVTVTVKKNSKATLWIILGGLGIVGLLSSVYFFFWIPPTKKIMVFFMHKDEEELAHALMPDSVKTEGYTVGHCSRKNIRLMKEKGLAIHILNTSNLLINTPGKTRSFHYSFKKGEPRLKSEKTESKPGENIKNLVSKQPPQEVYDFPSFHMITLDTPLLPAFEEKLKKIGINIIQHVPVNSYIIYVTTPDQLNALRSPAFNFIRLVSHYSAEDTGLIVREDNYRQAVQSGDQLILDLVLHREEDKASVINFLTQREINSLGSYRNRIRISVSARSVLAYNLAGNKFIQAIYEYIPPVLHNDIARQLIGIDIDVSGKSAISETGLGEIIGVADTGIDHEHPDLQSHIFDAVSWGRKETDDISDPDGHGTHVTASIVGDGTASGGKIKGMAPGARVFFQSLLDSTGSLAGFELRLQDIFMEAYKKGARIHNNSWGSAAEARYTLDSTIVDEFIYEHPEMLIVISAGNEGICNARVAAEKGYVGFGSVGSPATTKNGLTVGASRNKRTTGGYASATYGKIWPDKFPDPPTGNELISGDPNSIAAFSSRGRCDDYRMKPDIVAPGTDILSAKSSLAPLNRFHGGYASYDDAYAFLGGTSMAAPIVSGAAAIVREYYKKKRDCSAPSAALIKATLINGTRKLNGPSAIHGSDRIPNPNQGYGMLDLSSTIPNDQNQFQLEFRDSLQDPTVVLNSTGQAYTLQLLTKQVTWIRVCLAYTDFPVRAIQNDLDLLMDYEPTRQKWSGNLGINATDPFHQSEEDSTNNMEIIRIDTAQPGLYTIKVVAHNLPKGKQGFALVVTTGDLTGSFK